mmetsp:Transcript_9869/g.20390  ORF Transcript_9869/g.20390 Transcript_9869/m.20390 type:complete len:87 (+) Transcript_9869:61-321(+)
MIFSESGLAGTIDVFCRSSLHLTTNCAVVTIGTCPFLSPSKIPRWRPCPDTRHLICHLSFSPCTPLTPPASELVNLIFHPHDVVAF